jgi:mRNA interferase RelE/StbE
VYRLRILDAAARDLSKLDKQVALRILKRLDWLAANLDNTKLQPLSADLSEFHKLRVGPYRVIYEVLREESTLLIHAIGHRREVYKKS